MTEQELRQLVREAIARAGGGHSHPDQQGAGIGRTRLEPAGTFSHPSFTLLRLPDGSDSDGPCIIEPAVACNHCGYCKSYGH